MTKRKDFYVPTVIKSKITMLKNSGMYSLRDISAILSARYDFQISKTTIHRLLKGTHCKPRKENDMGIGLIKKVEVTIKGASEDVNTTLGALLRNAEYNELRTIFNDLHNGTLKKIAQCVHGVMYKRIA